MLQKIKGLNILKVELLERLKKRMIKILRVILQWIPQILNPILVHPVMMKLKNK